MPINIRMSNIDISNYSSRWAFMADRAGFTQKPLDDVENKFNIVGRFVGNWAAELDKLIALSKGGVPLNFLKKMEGGEDPYTVELDRNDLQSTGLNENTVFLNRIMPPVLNRSVAPTIFKMVDWFGFAGRVLIKIHMQQPGQVFPFHFDDLTTNRNNNGSKHLMDENPERWARVEVQLKDWEWGHVWGVGNTYWKQWRAGEIMFHPWHNLPHGTANCGMSPRICLQITGETTPELRQRLNSFAGDIKI